MKNKNICIFLIKFENFKLFNLYEIIRKWLSLIINKNKLLSIIVLVKLKSTENLK
jgi:hypothetical protein